MDTYTVMVGPGKFLLFRAFPFELGDDWTLFVAWAAMAQSIGSSKIEELGIDA